MAVLLVPRERGPAERRVAAVPETVAKLSGLGLELVVEKGAGTDAGHPDDAYEDAGARLVDDGELSWGEADGVAIVGPPGLEQVKQLRSGALLVGFLSPARNLDAVRAFVDRKVDAVAVELVPRISRAQSMDALSSQANLAGYRSVIIAAAELESSFPLFMTAAGTVRPATVVVLGAGVAGLQAIATARRLGAVVRANDIRPSSADEVRSLGAEFIDTSVDSGEATGGYARAVGAEELNAQQQILTEHLAVADAVICTAVVPGKPAPTLITEPMVEAMKPGAVIVDLAAAEGGNCALTDPTDKTTHGGVRIIPADTLARTMPGEASALYARNLLALLRLFVSDGALRVDTEDAVIDAALLTSGGEIRHQPTAELLAEETP